MTKKTLKPVPEHFDRGLSKIRQWISGFEEAGKNGPSDKDVLRQVQQWFRDYSKGITK